MNCLGPLLNPVGVRRQLVGVYERALVEHLAEALGALGSERALVVHGSDGLDELTTTGPSWAAHWRNGAVETLEIDPQRLGIAVAAPEALRGGDAAQNAGILRRVLDGSEGPQRDLVLLNAAAALWVAGAAGDLEEGLLRARESVDSGAARERLAALVRASAEAGGAS
jgi:anthranilate phosphoribosyltransferase